jgi:hypothetical protein
MMRLVLHLLAKWPTRKMLRAAAMLGILGAAVMAWSVLDPRPLPIVTSMTISPVLAGLAFLLYGLSIAADLSQTQARVHQAKLGGS